MAFPFTHTYKEKLNGLITSQDKEAILQYIFFIIEKKEADKIIVKNNMVSYNGSASNMRISMFGLLDSGKFSLIDSNGVSYLIYEFRTTQLFILFAIVSVFIAFISKIWWVGLMVFMGAGGLNWILHVDRHENLAIEIANDINKDFFEKGDGLDNTDDGYYSFADEGLL